MDLHMPSKFPWLCTRSVHLLYHIRELCVWKNFSCDIPKELTVYKEERS